MAEPQEGENQESRPEPARETYAYPDAGIRERSGYIPLWLILVAVGLIIWAVYYVIQNWSPPG